MATIVTADWHLSDNPRDAYRIAWLGALQDMIKQHNIAHLLVLGDLCEEKDRHSAWLVNKVVDVLATIAELCPITILQGNHDYVDIESPFYAFLGRLERVEYLRAPRWRKSLSRLSEEDWGSVLFLPHTPNWKRDWKNVDFSKTDWCFAHNTFNGADVGFGRKLDGIPLDVFPDGMKVISGDIHVPQQLGPVTYVGAPYTVDFGDNYKPRILVIEDGKVRSYGMTGPQKRLLEITSIKELQKQQTKAGDILKVRIRLRRDDYDRWPQMKMAVIEWGTKNDVQIHVVQPIIEQSRVNQKQRREDATSQRTDEELLEEYCKHRGIDTKTQRTGKLLMEAT